MAIPQVGATGLTFIVTFKDQNQVVVPLTVPGTTAFLYLRNPSGRVKACPMSWVVDGTDGRAQYVTVAGDLDIQGDWTIQGRVFNGVSTNYYSDVQPFRVAENIAP